MRKKINYFFVVFVVVLIVNTIACYAEDKKYFDGIVAFDLEEQVFRDFVENPSARFVEENCSAKYKYEKAEKDKKESISYEIRYKYDESNDMSEDDVYKRGNDWNGVNRFAFWFPIYGQFIDFINSEENIKDIVSNEEIYINDIFLYNVGRAKYFGIYVDSYPNSYFIEVSSKGKESQYAWDFKYTVYTPEEYRNKINNVMSEEDDNKNSEEGSEAIKIKINDEFVETEEILVENGRIFVPFRKILEKLGIKVYWDGENKTVFCENKGTEISFKVGSYKMTIKNNGIYENKEIDAFAKIKDGVTFVPLRAISEGFGFDVKWDSKNRIVSIDYKE